MPFDVAIYEAARSVGHEIGISAIPTGTMVTEKDRVLRGLVEQGHGLDAIATFLRVERREVLDWVIRLDLPTPHDRPMRRGSGAKAWVAGDYLRFIECWTGGWHAASIGKQFGRSAGAIWSKARWLGLPQRDRSKVLRAKVEPSTTLQTPLLPALECQRFVVTAAGERLPIRKILKRCHVYWTPELDAELANRYWANQHYEAIAAEWGLSARSISSRACRLELPRRERCKLVTHYDPSMIDATIAEARYVRRECMFIRGWLFWGPKNGLRTSKRGQKLQARSGAGYGFGIGHSIGGNYAFGL